MDEPIARAWLFHKVNRFEMAWSICASLVFHVLLVLLLTTTSSYFPSVGMVPRFDLIWVSPSSAPSEPPARAEESPPDASGLQQERFLAEKPPLAGADPTSAPPPIIEPAVMMQHDSNEDELPVVSLVSRKLVAPPERPPDAPTEAPLVGNTKESERSRPALADEKARQAAEADDLKAEQERLKSEQDERDRQAAQRERMEQAKRENAERDSTAEQARLSREREDRQRQADRQALQEKAERERAERERIAEQARQSQERKERQRQADRQALQERAERERAERERIAGQARLAREDEKRRRQADRQALETAERERARKERISEQARLSRDREQRQRQAEQREHLEKIERERAERERIAQQARLSREKEERGRQADRRALQEKAAGEKADRARTRAQEARLAQNRSAPLPVGTVPKGGEKPDIGLKPPEPVAEDKAPKPSIKPQEARGLVVTSPRGDLKLVITGDNAIKLFVKFREYPASRRNKVSTKSEARRAETIAPVLTRTREETREAVVETAREGIYVFSAEAEEKKGAKATFTLKVFESGARERTAELGVRTISGKAILVKILMPEAILWDDESAFSGILEDSESVIKFNAKTGLYWKEFNE